MVIELLFDKEASLACGLYGRALKNGPVNLFNCCIFPRFHCLCRKRCKVEKCSLSKMQM